MALILGIAACPAAESPQVEGDPCADSSAACSPGDTDTDTDGNTSTTPPATECVSDSDCPGFCGSCNAGVCQEDVGCCGQAGDDTHFRCSEDDSTLDGGSDGGSSSGSEGSGSGSGDTGSGTSGSDSGTGGSDTGGPTGTTAG